MNAVKHSLFPEALEFLHQEVHFTHPQGLFGLCALLEGRKGFLRLIIACWHKEMAVRPHYAPLPAKGKQSVVQFPVAVLVEAPVREHQLFILGLETVQDVCKVDSAAVVCLAHKEHIWVHKEADTDVLHWLREPCFCEVVPDTEGLIGQLYNDKVSALSAGIGVEVKVLAFLVRRDASEPLCSAGEGLFKVLGLCRYAGKGRQYQDEFSHMRD